MRNYPVTTGPAWRAIGLSCLLLALCGFCSSIHAQSIFGRVALYQNTMRDELEQNVWYRQS